MFHTNGGSIDSIIDSLLARPCPTYPDNSGSLGRDGCQCCFYCDACVEQHEQHTKKCPWAQLFDARHAERIRAHEFEPPLKSTFNEKKWNMDVNWDEFIPVKSGVVPLKENGKRVKQMVDGVKIVDVDD